MVNRLPARADTGHKGTFGKVAIAGGSIGGQKIMLGSAAFAAKAAIRSGAGMAVFIGNEELLTRLIELVPQAVGIVYDKNFSKAWDSIVIGPGLSVDKQNIELISKLLSLKLPTVIDADGLNTISKYPELARGIHNFCVLTPHPKEFERLSKALSVRSIQELTEKHRCTVVLKSYNTQIADGDRHWYQEAKNPVLATAGTGDVLAGLIAGLMAQYCPEQLSAFDCAKLGVEIHSKAAEKWRKAHGSGGLMIDELLELIPPTMEELRSS